MLTHCTQTCLRVRPDWFCLYLEHFGSWFIDTYICSEVWQKYEQIKVAAIATCSAVWQKYEQGDHDDAQGITAFWKIYFIENHCQTNISKGRRGMDFNTFFMKEITLYFLYMSLWHHQNT